MSKTTSKIVRVGVEDIVQSKIGVFSTVGMVYAICCAGAYGIEEMIPVCGPGLTITTILVLAFIWAIPYSMICADMGTARPVEGGTIIWAKEGLGEFWFGIMAFCGLLYTLVSNTVYVVLAIGYLGSVVELTVMEAYLLKVLMVLIFFTINILGLKQVGIVSTVMSIIIMAAFATVAVVGFLHWNQNPFEPFIPQDMDLLTSLGAGLAIGVWMFGGYDTLSMFGGEIENAKRVIPRALMIGIPLIMLTYVLPTMGGLASIGQWESWTTEPGGVGYASVLTETISPVFGVVFMIVAIIGQCSIFNMCIAVGGRTFLIIADENFGPKFFARLTAKKGTPYVGLIIVTVATTLLLPFQFGFLVVLDVFFMIMTYVLTVFATMALRRKMTDDYIKSTMILGRKTHTVFSISVLLVALLTLFLNGTDYFVGGLVWLLAVPLLYIVCKKRYGGLSVVDPVTYPKNPRTGLAMGDLFKIGYLYIGIGVFALIGRFFLTWYEGGYPEYYVEMYETGFFSDFWRMISTIQTAGIIAIVVGICFVLAGKKFEPKA